MNTGAVLSIDGASICCHRWDLCRKLQVPAVCGRYSRSAVPRLGPWPRIRNRALTPGKNSSGTLPNGPGGGVVTQPKWSPKSPIGTYHPRPPFSTTGPVGTYHSGGSPQGGPILLRSGGRR